MTEQTAEPTEDGTPDEASHAEGAATPDTPAEEQPETFDRDYVQKLRDEAAGHRVKAKRADALAAALVTAQAALTGKLADATDLPYSEGPARRGRLRGRGEGDRRRG